MTSTDSFISDGVLLKKIDLTPYGSDQPYNIIGMVMQFHIFEDIEKQYISGSVVIEDALDLIKNLPINGREKIHLKFKTPNIQDMDYIEQTFQVYKISDIERSPNQTTMTYKLHFITEDTFRNKKLRIQKSYSGKISNTVQRIFEDCNFSKPIEIDPTSNSYKFVSPNWTPYRLIKWLSNRSLSDNEYPESNFLFYQTLDSYHFKCVSNLLDQEPLYTYTYLKNMNINTENISDTHPSEIDRLLNIISIDIASGIDSLTLMTDGAFSSTLYEHDITKKTFTESRYNYIDDFTQRRSTEDYSLIDYQDDLNFTHKSIIDYRPTQSRMFDNIEDNNKYQQWVLKRRGHLSQLFAQKLEVIIPGNSDLRVGQVIEVKIPSFAYIDKDTDVSYDAYTKGKYMISSIHHMVTSERYRCKLVLVRDGRTSEIPNIVNNETTSTNDFDFFDRA